MEGTPWILISLLTVFILVIALVIILVKTTNNSGKSIFTVVHKPVFLVQFITGIACSLFGAFLMFNGDLFGDNTTGIARILGIIGISLVATSSPIGMALKKRT